MNNIKQWSFRVDLIKQVNEPFMQLVQQDVYTNEFLVTLLNNGDLIQIEDTDIITLTVNRPDGSNEILSGTPLGGGVVKFSLTYNAIAQVGVNTGQIKIHSGGRQVTSNTFNFNVIKDPYADTSTGVSKTPEYPLLTQLLNKLSEQTESAQKIYKFFSDSEDEIRTVVDNMATIQDLVKSKNKLAELISTGKELTEKTNKLKDSLGNVEHKTSIADRAVIALESALKLYTTQVEEWSENSRKVLSSNEELKELIRKGEALKELQSTLDSSGVKAKSIDEALKVTVMSATEINKTVTKAIAEFKQVDLKDDIEQAKAIEQKLSSNTKLAEQSNTKLERTKQSVEENNSKLEKAVLQASQLDGKINTLIETATRKQTELSELNESVTRLNATAEQTSESLNRTNDTATRVKRELERNIETGNELHSTLEKDIASAKEADKTLKSTTETADNSNSILVEEDTKAKQFIETLKELLEKASSSEQAIKEIIASGDLSKYITDPKLQEVLGDYATKDEISKIDVTSQLGEYLKTTTADDKYATKDELQRIQLTPGPPGPQGVRGEKGNDGPQGPRGRDGDPATNLVRSVNGKTGDVRITKDDLGINDGHGNVDINQAIKTYISEHFIVIKSEAYKLLSELQKSDRSKYYFIKE